MTCKDKSKTPAASNPFKRKIVPHPLGVEPHLRDIQNVDRIQGTTLDRGDELDALTKLPPRTRKRLCEQACWEYHHARWAETKKTARDKAKELAPDEMEKVAAES